MTTDPAPSPRSAPRAGPAPSAPRPLPAGGKASGFADFTQGPLALPLARFCVPILAATVLQSLSGTVNSAFVGRMLGAPALAAVTNGNLILFLLLGAAFGLVGAASIVVSQAVGNHDWVTARKTIGGAASWFALVSVGIAAAMALALPALFGALAVPDEIRGAARAYLLVSLAGIPFTYLFIFATSMVRAAGDARLPLHSAMLSVALNVGLTPAFIALGLGVAGSALATTIAQALALCFVVDRLRRSAAPLLPLRDELRLDPGQLRFLVTKGVPMAMQSLVIASGAVVLVRFVNLFGVTTVAAYGAASQIWGLAQMPAFAISSALMVVAGQNVGAGRWARVHRASIWAVGYQLVATSVVVALALGFAQQTMGLFTSDPQALAQGAAINRQVAWSFIVLGVTFVLFAPLRAAGKVMAPLLVAIMSLWVFRIGYVIAFLDRFGAEAIWQGIGIGAVVSLGLVAMAYWHGLVRSGGPASLAHGPRQVTDP